MQRADMGRFAGVAVVTFVASGLLGLACASFVRGPDGAGLDAETFDFTMMVLGIVVGIGSLQATRWAKSRDEVANLALVFANSGAALIAAFGFDLGPMELLAVVVVLSAAWLASRPEGSVFCEDCDRWTEHHRRVLEVERGTDVARLLADADEDALRALPRSAPANHTRIDLCLCPSCDASFAIMTQVTRDVRRPDDHHGSGSASVLGALGDAVGGAAKPMRISRAVADALMKS